MFVEKKANSYTGISFYEDNFQPEKLPFQNLLARDPKIGPCL